jgi:nicotinamide-nucleotide amidase
MRQMSIFDEVIDLARARGVTLGTCESLTGGLLSYSLSTSPGAGDNFIGAIVAYHRDVKYGLLQVPQGPVVNAETAVTMARTARRLLGCDAAVSLTGAAGPDPQDGMPVGTVFVAVDLGGGVDPRHFQFDGSPEEVRLAAAESAARLLLEKLVV